MECSCVRHSDVPGTSKLFSDLIQHFDRVSDLYPYPPSSFESLSKAAQFDFPDDRRAALVRALTPLNEGNPSLGELRNLELWQLLPVSRWDCSRVRLIPFTKL